MPRLLLVYRKWKFGLPEGDRAAADRGFEELAEVMEECFHRVMRVTLAAGVGHQWSYPCRFCWKMCWRRFFFKGVSTSALSRSSRPPLARMKRIHGQIDSGRYPNATSLAKELEVSSKTIRRDVEFMRDQLGLPIEYDARRYGYTYSEPVAGFPTVTVSEGEIVALFVAQRALEQYRGTSFEAPLKAAFAKLTEGLQEQVSFRWSDLDSAISFRGTGSTRADLELFDLLSRAVMEESEVELTYRKLTGKEDELRRVQPYHLTNVENCWYLIAYDLMRSGIRTFALPRVRDAVRLEGRFRKPEDFEISRFLADSFGVFSGSGSYEVRLQFDAFGAQLVSERLWHPSQRLRELEGEEPWRMELTMELSSLTEVVRWVLGWGRHCRVIGPERLCREVRSEVTAMLGHQVSSEAEN